MAVMRVPRRRSTRLLAVFLLATVVVIITQHANAFPTLAKPTARDKELARVKSRGDPGLWWDGVGYRRRGRERSEVAYAMYTAQEDYTCNCVMNAGILNELHTAFDIVILYPDTWNITHGEETDVKLLRQAFDLYSNIELRPVAKMTLSKGVTTYHYLWQHSHTKFHVFRLFEYSRILYFDSDTIVINSMDPLFDLPLPPSPNSDAPLLAFPWAYWNDPYMYPVEDGAVPRITTSVIYLSPSQAIFDEIMEYVDTTTNPLYDMDVLQELYGHRAGLLPHRGLPLLTNEIAKPNHDFYLRDHPDVEWNATAEAESIYLVHFSDYPMQKPWRPSNEQEIGGQIPPCYYDPSDTEVKDEGEWCEDALVWWGFYTLYRSLKETHCSLTVEAVVRD